MKYKTSEDWEALSAKNRKNAALKNYHHNMGSAGYAGAMPKWDKKEAELKANGVIPEPIREEWELRARNWFLGHGCEYDEVTGDIVESDGVRVPRKKWLEVVKQIKDGTLKFKADREKDLLTLVLRNSEK